jgi:hypothetical protein
VTENDGCGAGDLGMSAKGLQLDEDLPVFIEEVTNSLRRLKRRVLAEIPE